jgi:quercetin dioxygenase-like cupin family protein
MAARDETPARTTEQSVGDAVRRLRELKGMSVRMLAAASGFSPSFISQVENGQASPSINSLQHIVQAVGVTLGEFFQALEPRDALITRATERRQITSGWSRGTIQSLTTGGAGTSMDAILVTLAAGGSSGKHPAPQSHEEFAYVLEGSVMLTLEGEEIELNAGDSATIRAGSERRLRNASTRPAHVIIVSTRT